MRRAFLLAAASLLVAGPLTAQGSGALEIGGFGRYNWYDKSFNQIDSSKHKNSWGGGARIGYFLTERWSLELDGSANATDLDQSNATSVGLVYWPFHLRAIYNVPVSGTLTWMLGGGANYNRYNVTSEADQFLKKTYEGSDWGIGALTGFRLRLNETWALRVDGTMDYIPSPQNNPDGNNTMWGAQAGLSAFLGGSCGNHLDSIAVEPRSSTVLVGQQVNFTVRGYMCDGSSNNVTAASQSPLVAGNATLTGATFSSNTPGTYQVQFTNPAARKSQTAMATVRVDPRPAPAVTLTRVDLQPDNATIFVGERQNLTVMGHYSDGTSRALTNCQLTPDGGTVSNGAFSANVAGSYTVTAVCEGGQSDRSNITVRSINITVRALFEFNKTNVYIQAERDSLRWLATQLQEHPTLMLTIYGHTDWVGSVSYNDRLGTRRIQAVMDTLKTYGIPESRIATFMKRSFGECQPIASNRTNEGRALNRRVEIFDTPSAKQYEGGASCPNRP